MARTKAFWSKLYYRRRSRTDDGTVTVDALEGILEFQNYLCAICGEIPYGLPSFDHIKPLALGGTHSAANLQMTCLSCNKRKGKKYPYPANKPKEAYYEAWRFQGPDEWGTQDD